MILADVERLARSLMAEHGITCPFELDNARQRAGAVHWTRNRQTRAVTLSKLTVSRHLMALWDEPEVRDTILHEIAHILAGHEAGHGPVWQRHAARIGARPERCYDSSALPTVEAPWTGICPDGHEIARHRVPKGQRSCGNAAHGPRGFKPELVIVWHRTAELRRLQAAALAAEESESLVQSDEPRRVHSPVPASRQESLF
jgi:hypothetical protein